MRKASKVCSRVTALLALAGLASGAQAQSLGEAARKEKTRRESTNTAGPKKVYGEGELQSYAPPEAADGEPSPPDAAPGAQTPSNPRAEGPASSAPSGMDAFNKKAEKWRKRYSSLKQQIEDLERLIAELVAQGFTVLSEKEASELLSACPNTAGERCRAGRRQCAQAVIGLETSKKMLADLVEDARRHGVPSAQLE
ncbi:MAG TPA: hypothetical protein VI589_15700 [Vicinamibacteria bacterium]